MWRSLWRNLAGLIVGILMGVLFGAFFPKPDRPDVADNRAALESAKTRAKMDDDQCRELLEDNQRIKDEILELKKTVRGDVEKNESLWIDLAANRETLQRLGKALLALRSWADATRPNKPRIEDFPPPLPDDEAQELDGLFTGKVPIDPLDPNQGPAKRK